MPIQLSPSELPYEATGLSFIWTLRDVALTIPSEQSPTGPEVPLLLFRATTKPVVWSARKILIWPPPASTLVHVYADPVVSDPGAVQTPTNMRIGSGSKPTCGLYQNPVVTDPGRYLAAMLAPTETQSFFTFVIDPGHSLLVTTQQASGGNGTLNLGFSWWEV